MSVMEETREFNLYTWYQQVKKKDLGATEENWLQKLQEQALSLKRDKEHKLVGCTYTIKDEDITKSKSNCKRTPDSPVKGIPSGSIRAKNLNDSFENVSTKSSKCSTPRTPTKQVKSPFSALLDSSFLTPTLVLSHADDDTPHRRDYSPATLGLDLFSPLVSEANTSAKVAASLGVNFDDSSASWSSALATPLASDVNGHSKRNSPTTLERLTLHPKQELRHKVMARNLFSPRTPSNNQLTDGSPNLGIIKCYSPIPSFNSRATVQQRRLISDNNPECLLNHTQSFKICDEINSDETKTATLHSKGHLEGCIPAGFDSDDDRCNQKKKILDNGSHLQCGISKSVTSSQPEPEYQNTENGVNQTVNSQHCIATSNTPKDTFTSVKVVHIGKGKEQQVSLYESKDIVECNENNQSKCPFDLICSPVKSKEPEVSKHKDISLASTCKLDKMKDDLSDYSAPEEENSHPSKQEISPKLPVPLFRKEVHRQDEQAAKDADIDTPKPKDILSKLSHKKRLSGKFLYPRKSEEGYEKLNMKYQTNISDDKNIIVESDLIDIDKKEVMSENKQLNMLDTHNTPNRQQNFIPLAKFEKENHLGQDKINSTIESLNECNESSYSPTNARCQIVNLMHPPAIPAVSSEKLPAENGMRSSSAIKPKEIEKFDQRIVEDFKDNQQKSKYEKETSGLQLVPVKKHLPKIRVEKSENINNDQIRKPELPQSQSLIPSSCESMDDSFNDIDFAEIDLNFSVPNVNALGKMNLAKKLVANCLVESDYTDSKEVPKDFCGFSTGQGRTIKVSDAALQHAKKLLEETEEEKLTVQKLCDANENSPTNSVGFVHRNKPVIDLRATKMQEEWNADEVETKNIQRKTSTESGFCGFLTGHGQQVKVNENSLKFARKVLEDTTDDLENNRECPIQTTKTSMQKSNKLCNIETELPHSSTKPSKDCNVGFEIASGLNIADSSESTDCVRNLWEEEMTGKYNSLVITPQEGNQCMNTEKDHSEQTNNPHSKTVLNSEPTLPKDFPCQGFSTAAGKAMSISETALKHAKILLEDASEETAESSVSMGNPNCLGHASKNVNEMLSTKQSAISYKNTSALVRKSKRDKLQLPEARKNRMSLMKPSSFKSNDKEDIQQTVLNGNFEDDDISFPEQKETKQFKSFCTASGSAVKVSEAALLRARKMWAEDNADADSELPVKESDSPMREELVAALDNNEVHERGNSLQNIMEANRTATSYSFVGFCTGRGKQVDISKEALAKAKKLLDEDVSAENIKGEGKKNDLAVTVDSKGEGIGKVKDHYKDTARDLQVQENGCSRKEILLEASIKETNKRQILNESAVNGSISAPSFQGFCTGHGKQVHINKEALVKAKKILGDEDTSKEDTDGKECKNTEGRNGHGVVITEERSALEEKPFAKEQNLWSNKCGFVTGKGKSIKVSDEALKRANLLMEENLLENSEKLCEGKKEQKKNLPDKISENISNSLTEVEKEAEESQFQGELDEKCEMKGCDKESNKDNATSSQDERERTPSPILGSQKPNMKIVQGQIIPDFSVKRKFSEITLPEQEAETYGHKKLYENSNNNYILTKNAARYGKKGFSQSPKHSTKLYAHLSKKVHSQPNALLSSINDQTKGNLRSQKKNPPPSDTQEICAITEAFLADDLMDEEESLESNGIKRSREDEESDEPSYKKSRNMHCQLPDEESTVTIEAVESGREMLRLKQLKVICYKEKRSVQPIQGILHKLRTDQKDYRIKLQSLGPLKIRGKILQKVANINGDKAMNYRFPVNKQSCESVSCEEGCNLVPGVDGCIGVKEVERGFLATPGVHPSLLPPGWVANHYRWIVWSLAALERRLLQCDVFTVQNVVARMKYRYDREIDRAERPILRKIMEHDDVPQKTMILCVVDIKVINEASVNCEVAGRPRSPSTSRGTTLELTDGWYSTGAIIDAAMEKLILDEKVKVGMKLVIHGAEMAKQGPPSHPLQASSPMCLRIHTNMTRRAKWWSRLGLIRQSGPLPCLMGSILGDGGLVGRLEVLLARVYPPLYFEKMSGKSVFRSERAHLKLLRENQQQKERNIQQVLAQVEQEYDLQLSQSKKCKNGSSLSNKEIRNLTSGRDIAELMEEALDPSNLEGILSTHQIELARSWKQKEADEKQRKINAEVQRRLAKKQSLYEAVTVLKVRVMDVEGASAIVTIWRPAEELRQALSEGNVYAVNYLCAVGHRYGDLQLTATRQSVWERIAKPSYNDFNDVARQVTPLCLMASDELEPPWKEVDIVGIVLRIGSFQSSSQIIHIVDHRSNIVALKFWGGIKECGVEDIIQIGMVICVSNGSWRGHAGGTVAYVHITELTAVTSQPRSHHLEEQVAHIKKSVKNMKILLEEGELKLDGQFDDRIITHETVSSDNGQEMSSRITQNTKDEIGSKETKHSDSDARELNENTPGSNFSVRQQQRSREIRSKLKTLGNYGTPSAMRTLKSPASSGAHKPFRMPLRQPKQSDNQH